MTKEAEAVGIPTQFRKRPIVVEAVQFTGDNRREVLAFAYPSLSEDALSGASIMKLPVVIETLEGDMTASEGDWIIKGVKGEFYPCKPDIFAATYEPVESEQKAEAGLRTYYLLGAPGCTDPVAVFVDRTEAERRMAFWVEPGSLIPVVPQAEADARIAAERERADELQRQLAEAQHLIGDAPNIKTTLPPEFQRLWEACNTLVEKAQFKAIFRHLEEVEKQLADATARIKGLEEDAAFGRQCRQDDFENAYVTASVAKELTARAEQAEADCAGLRECAESLVSAFDTASEPEPVNATVCNALDEMRSLLDSPNAGAAILDELRELWQLKSLGTLLADAVQPFLDAIEEMYEEDGGLDDVMATQDALTTARSAYREALEKGGAK